MNHIKYIKLLILLAMHSVSFANIYQSQERVQFLTSGLPLHGMGLEIAPFYRPTLLKNQYNIYYTDYTTADDLIKKHENVPNANDIRELTVNVDYIWKPGKLLSQCVNGNYFDYAISSHVIEHVPNVIGWISQIFSVLKINGILSLAVPDKRYTFDAYRRNTELHELIDLWIRNQSIPSPAQIFDMLSNSCDAPPGSQKPAEEGFPFESLHRNYTNQQALDYALHSYTTGEYLDIHCSVFTPESLKILLTKIVELGILNATISEPISNGGEFYIQLIKLGEPKVKPPHPKPARTYKRQL